MFNNVFSRSVSKGDVSGHSFHGNQFVAGTGTRQENSKQHLSAANSHQSSATKLQDKYASGGDRKNMVQADLHEYAAKLHQAASDAALVEPAGYSGHGKAYATARDKANAASAKTSTASKGDSAGHEFHGNQWTAGSHSGSGNSKPDTKAIGKYLAEVGKSYHGSIPLTQMIDKLASHGYHAVQEDGTAWSGMLTGRDGRTTIDLRNASNGKVDNGLAIQWHKMDSGKWEVNSYLTGASAHKSETENSMNFLNVFAKTSPTATKAEITQKADLSAMRSARDKALAAGDKANDMGQAAIAGSASHAKAASAHEVAAKAHSQAAQAANAAGSSNVANFMANEAYKHQSKASNHNEWANDQSNLNNGDAS